MIEDTPPSQKTNILKIKFGIFSPNDFFEKHKKAVSFIYVLFTYFSLPVFLISVLLNMEAFRSLSMPQIKDLINMENILIYLAASFFALLVHELSHAVAAKRNGANVAEIGIMLYVFQPFAYCTLCSMENISNFRKRAAVYAAGINSNLMLCGIVFLIAASSGNGSIGQHTITVALTNLVPILLNFIVFMKYDSYYLLSDLLGESRLRENTFSYLKSALGMKTHNTVLHSSQKLVYWTYGVLSGAFFLLLPILMATAIIMEFV